MDRIEYNITFSFKNIGYQIFVNDILVDQRLNGGMNNSLNMNEFLTNHEKTQKIKIRLIGVNGSKLTKEDITAQQCIIFRNNKNSDELTTFYKFDFQGNDLDLPIYELEKELTIKDFIQSNGIEVLRHAVDLSKIDKNILEKSVKDKFELLKNELNNGNYDFFLKELKFRNDIFFESRYYTEEDIQRYLLNARKTLKEYKSLMLPIENYKMVISGKGKLVTLERIDKNYFGDCVLLAKNLEDKILYLNYITFYIPNNEQQLHIYNMNAKATSLD